MPAAARQRASSPHNLHFSAHHVPGRASYLVRLGGGLDHSHGTRAIRYRYRVALRAGRPTVFLKVSGRNSAGTGAEQMARVGPLPQTATVPYAVSLPQIRSLERRQPSLLDGVAGNHALAALQWDWSFLPAAFVCERTSRMEGAARWRINRVGNLARHGHSLPAGHLDIGDGVEQQARIRMLWTAKQVLRGRNLA